MNEYQTFITLVALPWRNGLRYGG